MYPIISVTPKDCLADEDVSIRVAGLKAYHKVTIHAVFDRNDTGRFESSAKYTASSTGVVDLAIQPSIGGSYTGVEPMGLFWSMKASLQNNIGRQDMNIRDVETPSEVAIRVYDSHADGVFGSGIEVLAKTVNIRRYKGIAVRRIPVKWKRVRGTLFVPKGTGPFPTVIVLNGKETFKEHRASLLASRGFLSLSLAVFGYDDLPKSYSKLDLEYFEEAKEFLETLPETRAVGIGIYGYSLGATIALACATYIPGFKCAVAVAVPIFAYMTTLRYKGRVWPEVRINHGYMYEEDGDLVTAKLADDYYDDDVVGNSLIDFSKSDKSFFIVFCEDDKSVNTEKAVVMTKRLIDRGCGKYTLKTCPGTGHLVQTPYTPHRRRLYSAQAKKYVAFGGISNMHARAEKRIWVEMQEYLKRELSTSNSKL